MKDYYRTPQAEEAERNIIMQNRCGNRLSLLCHQDHCALELDYKPNAFRRKDYRARNFSNRDNHSLIFPTFTFPDIHCQHISAFHYDPFHTVLEITHDSAAKNTIHLINLAKDNAFIIAARCPLLVAINPHQACTVSDGLLSEQRLERGEQICSFVSFNGFEDNRYRQLDDGTHILQIMENDLLLIGAEETPYLAQQCIHTYQGQTLQDCLTHNEQALEHDLKHGKQEHADHEWQEIADLNQRVVWSGLDQGGACFGAINRIYHLIWVRDGSMTSNHVALAGNCEAIRIWAPFLLANPSKTLKEDGSYREEFLQILGSRWTKAEDDGLFYACWTLFTHFRCTGDDSLIHSDALALLLRCTKDHLEKCWDEQLQLMGSDTLGEDVLAGSVYYGYDIVNGSFVSSQHHQDEGKQIERCYSLYHQINTYNVLCMLMVLIQQRQDLNHFKQEFAHIANSIVHSLRHSFCNEQHELYSMYVQFDDGSNEWVNFGYGCDYWEHAWAVSQGPFYPVPDLQLASTRLVLETWANYKPYGYCPWNVLARSAAEFGLPSDAYKSLLTDEIQEAQHCPQKYPMAGALTEYHGAIEGWRGLPFSAGSFLNSTASQLLQSQSQGLAVRGGLNINSLGDFQYRLARIQVQARGQTDGVISYQLNQKTFKRCLHIGENHLRAGNNEITIERGTNNICRIHGSNAELLQLHEDDTHCVAEFSSAHQIDICIEHFDKSKVQILDQADHPQSYDIINMPDCSFTVLRINNNLVQVHVQ